MIDLEVVVALRALDLVAVAEHPIPGSRNMGAFVNRCGSDRGEKQTTVHPVSLQINMETYIDHDDLPRSTRTPRPPSPTSPPTSPHHHSLYFVNDFKLLKPALHTN